MPTFLEFSVVPESIDPLPLRRFCIRADASFRQLRDAIVVALGWESTDPDQGWLFEIAFSDGTDVSLMPYPDRLRHSEPGIDPEVTPITHYLDSADVRRYWIRYFHDAGAPWRLDVVVNGRWEVLDERLGWLVLAEHPWPPFEVGGPRAYARLQEAVRTGRDPLGLVAFARDVLDWTPELDVDALAARFARSVAAG